MYLYIYGLNGYKNNHWIWIHRPKLRLSSSPLMIGALERIQIDAISEKKLCILWIALYCDVLMLLTTAASLYNACINSLKRSTRDRLKHNRFDPVQERGWHVRREKTSTRVRCGWDPFPLAASNKQGSVTPSELRVPFKYVFVMQQFSTSHLSAYMYG